MKAIFKEGLPRYTKLDMVGQRVALTKVAKLRQFPPEAPLILNRNTIGPFGPHPSGGPVGRGPRRPRSHDRGAWAGILKGGGARVVVHEVLHAVLREPHLPTVRQGDLALLLALRPRVFPLGSAVFVIDKIDSSVGFDTFLPSIGEGPEAVVLGSAISSGVGVKKPLVFYLQYLRVRKI